MSRAQPKPFWWKARQCYYLRLNGNTVKLSPDKDEAHRRYHEIMAAMDRRDVRKAVYSETTPVLQVFNDFLVWSQQHNAPRTYDCYRQYLSKFSRTLPVNLTCREFSVDHFEAWIATHPTGKNPATRRGALYSIIRAFRWAMRYQKLTFNPVQCVPLPPPQRRNSCLSEQEFTELMSLKMSQNFRTLLRFCWLTGVRAMEAFILQWDWVSLEEKIIIIPKEFAKGKKKPRIIVLCDEALALVRNLPHHVGHVFRNCHNRPWRRSYVFDCFQRLRTQWGKQRLLATGWKPDPKAIAQLRQRGYTRYQAIQKLMHQPLKKIVPMICLTTLRHSFCTRALKSGMNTVTVAELMGHSSTRMVSEVYQHLGLDKQHLQ